MVGRSRSQGNPYKDGPISEIPWSLAKTCSYRGGGACSDHSRNLPPSSRGDAIYRGTSMKAAIAWPIVAIVMLGGLDAALARDLKDEVKIEIESTEVHPGMEPGMYVCAAGHLHIKGTVQNLAGVPVGLIKVVGKVF